MGAHEDPHDRRRRDALRLDVAAAAARRADRAHPPREVGRQRLPGRHGRARRSRSRAGSRAVCDVYDALTNERPYKKAWPVDEAVALVRAESGKHFDPAVVDAFLAAVGEAAADVEPLDLAA